jgi:hypothetical protein
MCGVCKKSWKNKETPSETVQNSSAMIDKTGFGLYNKTSRAGVAELADASDSKSDEEYLRKGSIPFSGIFILS